MASGEPLPAIQPDITASGHAIEARLYAEDPARDFAPSIGRLALFRTPSDGDGVRVDTGFATGDSVSVHYDAMLAKLICHGPTREAALRRMKRALDACMVAGVASNLDMLGRIVVHADFMMGGIDTGFIARHATRLLPGPGAPNDIVLATAALVTLHDEAVAAGDGQGSPWDDRDLWWLNRTPHRTIGLSDGSENWTVMVSHADGSWRIDTGEASVLGQIACLTQGQWRIVLDGVSREISAYLHHQLLTVRLDGQTWRLTLLDRLDVSDDEEDAADRLVAPIPGQVTQVAISAGDRVERGQVLVVLEAMKTVFRLTAPANKRIASVSCIAGEMVQEGQVLVSFAETED